MILQHLASNWEQHVAAGGATFFDIFAGKSIISSIIVGVAVYCITSLIKLAIKKLITLFSKE